MMPRTSAVIVIVIMISTCVYDDDNDYFGDALMIQVISA